MHNFLHKSRVLVGRGGFEPPKSKTSDLQSDPFGRSGICPFIITFLVGAGDWTRTHNLLITNQLLCQLSYTGLWCLWLRHKGSARNPLRSLMLPVSSCSLTRTTVNAVFLATSHVPHSTQCPLGVMLSVVPWGGIEPPTGRFSVCCSTD